MKKRIISILMALVMALSLLPAGALAAGLPFTDVKTSDWFYNDVKKAYDDGLINGKTATIFDPSANLTYAQAVKLAACMHQRKLTGMVTLVNGDPWYSTYVGYAKDNGIISKDYNWNAFATRAGYMEIFAHALPAGYLPAINNIPDGSIADVPMSHPQADAIYTLYRAGILQGSDSAHNCYPNNNIKRSEVSAILTRMMDSTARISFTMGEIPEELTIISQPANVACAVGDTAVFSVGVSGGKEAYKYQWQGYSISARKYLNVVGGTSATLSFTVKEADFKDISKVRCVITDAEGTSVTSGEAKLIKAETVAPLTITTQPKDVTCSVGDTATYTVAVSGGKAPYTYTWQWNPGTGYSNLGQYTFNYTEGLGTATLKIKKASEDALSWNGSFRCVITDADGNKVTSNGAKLSKAETTAPLKITTQPKDVTVAKGSSATFTVAASGGKSPYTYQWEVYSPNPKNYSWHNLSGATSNTCKVTNVTEEQFNFKYRCTVTDADGNTVTSNEVKLIKAETTAPLKITTQPKDVTCSVGDTATYTVAVSGGKAPYTYTWQWNPGTGYSNLGQYTFNYTEGLGTATLKIKNVSETALSWNGSFRCVITDADGNKVTSSGAKLSKTAPLSVRVGCAGANESQGAMLQATVTGGVAPYTYKWDTGTTTTTNATYHTIWVSKGKGGTCTVTDANGTTVSATVQYDPYWFRP